ncbi:hypothetical protein [Chitinophaga sp. YIM B06452]|uniref:hypothetical protein n=1 Tax=Chitinophaga sp. YIM B06452 TaxID=3082158 RepID=UPI0031FEB9C2
MNHNKKKKYINLKEEGKTAEELLALMLEEGVAEAEAKEVIEEIFKAPSAPEKKPKAPEEEAVQHNQVYEEWKLESNGRGGFERSRKIKETKISPDRAERLNEQKENRKIEYVKKGGANA